MATIFCSQCGSALADQAQFCWKCGRAARSMPTPRELPDPRVRNRRNHILLWICLTPILITIAWIAFEPMYEKSERIRIDKLRAKQGYTPAPDPSKSSPEKSDPMTPEQRGCAVIYLRTYNKRIADLTTADLQMMRYCESLGLYRSP
jgi:hypothetical protein